MPEANPAQDDTTPPPQPQPDAKKLKAWNDARGSNAIVVNTDNSSYVAFFYTDPETNEVVALERDQTTKIAKTHNFSNDVKLVVQCDPAVPTSLHTAPFNGHSSEADPNRRIFTLVETESTIRRVIVTNISTNMTLICTVFWTRRLFRECGRPPHSMHDSDEEIAEKWEQGLRSFINAHFPPPKEVSERQMDSPAKKNRSEKQDFGAVRAAVGMQIDHAFFIARKMLVTMLAAESTAKDISTRLPFGGFFSQHEAWSAIMYLPVHIVFLAAARCKGATKAAPIMDAFAKGWSAHTYDVAKVYDKILTVANA